MSHNRRSLRIAITADLHYGITRPDTIAALVNRIAENRCDLVLIAGDIGEPDGNFRRTLELFTRLDFPRALVAGNHDLWAKDYSSRYLWDDVLPDLTRRHGFRWLDGENLILGEVGVCGTIGWYDYSAKDPRLSEYDNERYAKEKANFNYDAVKIDWPMADQEFAALVLAGFRERIIRLEQNTSVSQIIVLTHVPPFPEQIIRKPENDFFWNVNNAYFGNLTLGREIERHHKVQLAISGHTHVAVDANHFCADSAPRRAIRVITIGSQYYQPHLQIIDLPV